MARPRIGQHLPALRIVRGSKLARRPLLPRRRPRELVDLKGRDPKEFSLSTNAQAALRRFAEFAERADPAAVVRGAFTRERSMLAEHSRTMRAWLGRLLRALEEVGS